MVTMKFERSTKHSHLFKAEDGSNAYIKKDHLEGSGSIHILTDEEMDALRNGKE